MVKTGYMMNDLQKILEKAKSLKAATEGLNGLNSDGSCSGELVLNLTCLQDLYKQLLITNLEYALDKKIDHDLWNGIFKNRITAIQQRAKDKNNTKRGDAQILLTSFLDSASGFYSNLLHELCHTFNVDIPGRVKSSKLNVLRDNMTQEKSCILQQPEPNSCQYMCQHCLVHLGDIARYRNQNGQAESYYHHAAQLLPSSGHPYNQLAILAAANGDVLKMAFFYCRSIAVKGPFVGSDTNLRRNLSKIISGDDPKHVKISTSELIKFFLKLHACIYLKKKDNELPSMVERLCNFLRAHLRAGSLSHQQIIHMAFINLFSLQHLSPLGIRDGSPVEALCVKKETRGDDVTNNDVIDGDSPAAVPFPPCNVPWNAMLTFTLQSLGELLACVPIHSEEPSELDHPVLPAIKLLLDWFTSNASVLKRSDITSYSRVWPRLAKVLNALGNQDKANDMNGRPLPEDVQVRGFIGLFSSLQKLDFKTSAPASVKRENLNGNNNKNGATPNDKLHACRCYRLFQLGMAIAEHNPKLLQSKEENNSTIFSSSVLPSPQHSATQLNSNGGGGLNEIKYYQNSSSSPHPHNISSENGLLLDDLDYEVSSPNRSGDFPKLRRSPFDQHNGYDDDTKKSSLTRHKHQHINTNSTSAAIQMKLVGSGDKLKVITEEETLNKFHPHHPHHQQHQDENCSNASTADADSLSQGELNPNSSPLTAGAGSGPHHRTGNRVVTFAPGPTQQYSPYRSPSPSSLTPDSYTDGSGLYNGGSGSGGESQFRSIVQSTSMFQPPQQQQSQFKPPVTAPPPPSSNMFPPRTSTDPFAPATFTSTSKFNVLHPPPPLFPPHHFSPAMEQQQVMFPPHRPPPPPQVFQQQSSQHDQHYLNNMLKPRGGGADLDNRGPPPSAAPSSGDFNSYFFNSMPPPPPASTDHLKFGWHIPPPALPTTNHQDMVQRMVQSNGGHHRHFNNVEQSKLFKTPQSSAASIYQQQPPPPTTQQLQDQFFPAAAINPTTVAAMVSSQQHHVDSNMGLGQALNNTNFASMGTAATASGGIRHNMQQPPPQLNDFPNSIPNNNNLDSMKNISSDIQHINLMQQRTALMRHHQLQQAAKINQDFTTKQQQPAPIHTTHANDNKFLLDHPNSFGASLVASGKSKEESYQLFPDTDSAFGITRGNNDGTEGFGTSSALVGTIGSERAAANYSRWNNTSPPNNNSGSNYHSMLPSNIQQPQVNPIHDDQHGNRYTQQSQSFWSDPMPPVTNNSAKSALEQLLRRQQKQQQQMSSGNIQDNIKSQDPPP